MAVRWPHLGLVLALLAPALLAAPFGGSSDAGDGSDDDTLQTGLLKATVRKVGAIGAARTWAVTDADGTPLGTRDWKAFTVGGNCCEHYLATTPDGRILNLGGAHPTWSADGGATWWRATPQMILLGAEGGIVAAPGGDIVGMTWDPYTGDQVVSYRYDAATDTWHWNLVNLKTPFYDRPWISVAPGPFEVGGVTIPYVSFIKGGLIKSPLYMSLDGLHYSAVDPGNIALAQDDIRTTLPDLGVTAPVDHLQGNREATGIALPRGGWLGPLFHFESGGPHAALLTENLTWAAYAGPIPNKDVFIDSSGAIHQVFENGGTIRHRLSLDGGETWRTHTYGRSGAYAEEWDFKANGDIGLAALLVRWGSSHLPDQDIVYKVWDYATDLTPDEALWVGDGDIDTRSGLGNSPRYDFATLAILPDGRVVASFADRSFSPGFAIESESSGLVTGVQALFR